MWFIMISEWVVLYLLYIILYVSYPHTKPISYHKSTPPLISFLLFHTSMTILLPIHITIPFQILLILHFNIILNPFEINKYWKTSHLYSKFKNIVTILTHQLLLIKFIYHFFFIRDDMIKDVNKRKPDSKLPTRIRIYLGAFKPNAF